MGKSILIVEQDESLGDSLAQSFKKDGYVCAVFRRSVEGFKKIKEMKPDIIVLDNAYRGMIAPELAAAGVPKTPVVFVNPLADPNETVRRALAEVRGKLSLVSMTAGLASKKILWVEDDKLIADILNKKFNSYGCQISLFKNGIDALAYVEKEKPDVIILDILLPGMGGFDVLKKIRGNSALDTVPVLMLSNLNGPADMAKARDMGAQKFLVKASTPLDEIVKIVIELMQSPLGQSHP